MAGGRGIDARGESRDQCLVVDLHDGSIERARRLRPLRLGVAVGGHQCLDHLPNGGSGRRCRETQPSYEKVRAPQPLRKKGTRPTISNLMAKEAMDVRP
jgi:hypothetical protein